MEPINKDFNISNLPSREKIENILIELKKCDLSKVSYQKILYILSNELKIIPYVTTKLKAGFHIERARINKPKQIFKSEQEISYRTDFENINNFGRANPPKVSLFYGAIKSDHVEYPRIINLFETSELYRKADKKVDTTFFLTVGKWRILKDIEAVEIVFNKAIINSISQIKNSYEYHMKHFSNDFPDRVYDIERLLEFFSDEFVKKVNPNEEYNYKISAAYADLAINLRNLGGVVYPSVRADYHGFNVALSIPVVENYLKLEVVAMFKVIKRGSHSFIDNSSYATDLGAINSNFMWNEMENTDEEIINKILLDD